MNCKKIYETQHKRLNESGSLGETIKSYTGHSLEEIENEFDCRVLGFCTHRKEEYVIFIDDKDEGGALLYGSDIKEHFKSFNELRYVVVSHDNDKFNKAVRDYGPDGLYSELFDTKRVIHFAPDLPGTSGYSDSDIFTGLSITEEAQLEREVKEFNQTCGEEILKIVEENSFDDGSDTPSAEELEVFKSTYGKYATNYPKYR